MQVGWICVKHGFANAAPRLCARQIAVALDAFGVRGQEEDVRVAARGEHDGVRGCAADLAGRAGRATTMPTRVPSVDDDVEHLGARVQRDLARRDLAHHRLVGAEQQLLAGLAARVERARHLRAAERAVVEQAAVLARERHALRGRLVDDLVRDLREPVDVRLARAEVAALDRVVEEPEDRVAVVAVVLGGVDPALGGDRVRAPRRVVEREDARPRSRARPASRRPKRRPGPVPTTMILKRRLLDALTSRTLKRWLSHARWIEPGGIIDSSVDQFDHSEHDGERERDVADHDQAARTRSRTAAATVPHPAHALEQAPRAVVEVHPERQVRDHVDERDRHALEATR